MNNKPLVSVIMPTLNREKTISRAIKSFLGQSYSEIELLIVDGYSSDNTYSLIKSFDDKRVKFFVQDKNYGPSAARNEALLNARGEFIAFLDSDDEWLPQKIQIQLNVFKTSPVKIGLLFTNGYSHAEKRNFFEKDKCSGIVYEPDKDKFFPLRILISTPSSWMLPAEVVRDIGYFDEKMYNWEDGDYLARVAYRYPIYFLNENLVIWHAPEDHGNVIRPNLILGKEIFLKNNFERMKKDKEYLFRFYRALGKDAISIDKVKSRKYLLKALLMRPYDGSIISKLVKTLGVR